MIKINIRQQKYKKNRLMGMNKYNSAIAAGYSESTAKSHTKELEARVKIADTLECQGLTDKALVEKLAQLLNASKVIGYLNQYKKGKKGGIEKISADQVVSNDFIDVPDWSARAKGLELAFKLKELLRDKVEHSGKIEGGESRVIIIREIYSGNQGERERLPGSLSAFKE